MQMSDMRNITVLNCKEELEYRRRQSLKTFSDYTKSEKKAFIAIVIIAVLITVTVGLFFAAEMSSEEYTLPDKIISMKREDNNYISYKEVQEKVLNENSASNILNLSFSDMEYTVGVETEGYGYHRISTADGPYYLDRNKWVQLEINVTEEECKKAFKDGEPVAVTAYLTTRERRTKRVIYSENFQMNVAPCVVESIKPLNDEKVIVYEGADVAVVEGREFEIVYGDGRRVTAKAKAETDKNGRYRQTLDGMKLRTWLSDEGDEVYVFMADAECILKAEGRERPFEISEITEYELDSSHNLKSISYKLKYTDGRIKEYKKESIQNYELYNLYTESTVDVVDGYEILAQTSIVYPEDSDEAKMKIRLVCDEFSENPIEAEKEISLQKSECNCICHSTDKNKKKLYEKLKRTAEIWGLFDECKCGSVHY